MNTRILNIHDNGTVKWEHEGERYCLHIQQDTDVSDPREECDQFDLMACWHKEYRLGDNVDEKTPEEFWRRLVRENVSNEEIYAAAEAGKLYSIRLAVNSENPELVDVYETYFMRTVVGSTPPGEVLEYESLSREGVADYILDDLTIGHCVMLMKPYMECLPLWLYDHGGITMSCGARTYPYNDRWDSGQVGWILMLKKTALTELGMDEAAWRERAVEFMEGNVKEYDQYLRGDAYGYDLYKETDDGEWEDTGESCWGFFGSDVLESGLAESVGHGLYEAVQAGNYETGTARERTTVSYVL